MYSWTPLPLPSHHYVRFITEYTVCRCHPWESAYCSTTGWAPWREGCSWHSFHWSSCGTCWSVCGDQPTPSSMCLLGHKRCRRVRHENAVSLLHNFVLFISSFYTCVYCTMNGSRPLSQGQLPMSGDVISWLLDTPPTSRSCVCAKMASNPAELNLLNNIYQALSRKWGKKRKSLSPTYSFLVLQLTELGVLIGA